MKTLLIVYIIIINLIGFFIMGIDKRRAVRRMWRVAERTLFTIALLFGSIGILTGMYVFRHKTKHLSFAIGIPAILVLQLLAISFLFSWNNQRMGSPSQVVQHELELIKDLDNETIQSFVSYENLMNSHIASGTIDDETAEAVDLFFQNFTYHIHHEQIDGNRASVSVNITNLDMHALAADLCTEICKQSAAIYPAETPMTTSDYYRLLRDTQAANTYEQTVTTAYFQLEKDESGWFILADRTLEDELVSGFISYMNDPYILPASRVLAIHLDALKELSADEWAKYLAVSDVFATFNTDYSQQIDAEYLRQLAASFDYKIMKCTEKANTASAAIRITSVNMANVFTIYKKHLLDYASTSRSIRDDDITFSNETSHLLLQSLLENNQTASTDIDLTITNNGKTWEVYFDDAFINALMGDMNGAIETFNSLNKGREVEVIQPAG